MNDRHGHDEFDASRLPRRSGWLFNRFARYVQWYLGRHFDAVRLLGGGRDRLASLPADRPVIVFSNHPSWWDPLVGTAVTAACLGGRKTYAPIEAAMLEKYKVFGMLGFFGIESDSRRGGASFLRTGDAVLLEPTHLRNAPRNAIWITAEGFFSDPRHRPVELRPGVAHLAARRPEAIVVPLAMEYPFWTERKPEALAAIGEPIDLHELSYNGVDDLDARLAEALQSTMDALAESAIAKNPDAFETLIAGRGGISGLYDWIRLMGAWARGRRFDSRHLPEHRHAH
ncbi:MAG: lysophospholipid acyltransferase family protein [Phycisphaeraceae bacterium]